MEILADFLQVDFPLNKLADDKQRWSRSNIKIGTDPFPSFQIISCQKFDKTKPISNILYDSFSSQPERQIELFLLKRHLSSPRLQTSLCHQGGFQIASAEGFMEQAAFFRRMIPKNSSVDQKTGGDIEGAEVT